MDARDGKFLRSFTLLDSRAHASTRSLKVACFQELISISVLSLSLVVKRSPYLIGHSLPFPLTGWYKRSEFGIRAAIFFSAATVSGAFGGLLAVSVLHLLFSQVSKFISLTGGNIQHGGHRWKTRMVSAL